MRNSQVRFRGARTEKTDAVGTSESSFSQTRLRVGEKMAEAAAFHNEAGAARSVRKTTAEAIVLFIAAIFDSASASKYGRRASSFPFDGDDDEEPASGDPVSQHVKGRVDALADDMDKLLAFLRLVNAHADDTEWILERVPRFFGLAIKECSSG